MFPQAAVAAPLKNASSWSSLAQAGAGPVVTAPPVVPPSIPVVAPQALAHVAASAAASPQGSAPSSQPGASSALNKSARDDFQKFKNKAKEKADKVGCFIMLNCTIVNLMLLLNYLEFTKKIFFNFTFYFNERFAA